MLEGGWGWVIIAVGLMILGILIAYGLVQWRRERDDETMSDEIMREKATREYYEDQAREDRRTDPGL